MNLWYALLGLALMLAGLVYCGWKVWQMGWRGWKDHLWIWDDANRAARFLAIIMGAQAVGRWVWYGMKDEVIFFLIGGAILVPIPYIAYTIGRLLGMRDRARHGHRLS
ncbi:hypothetical protein [Erythrobacter donghaensis]|uniref:hypothetical protein n=1 Tax=Erythrobacter donghaensis TaxID=267135 RepID=UPI00117C040F|nr:hypothetical protein [Erythrobacter donghaensis]